MRDESRRGVSVMEIRRTRGLHVQQVCECKYV